jgi:transcription antitermination factor NusG
MSEAWYALHVKPRLEHHVHHQLRDKGYDSFLPTSISRRKWSDRTKTLSLPLFPGYVFCRFDIHSRLPVMVTPGVQAVVSVGKTPAEIDEAEIAAIQLVVQSGLQTQPWPYVSVGDKVQVEEGPLAGLTGIVIREKNFCRLIISISLLMRSVSVEIDRSAISVVKDPKPTAIVSVA